MAKQSPIIRGIVKLTGLSWESFVAQQDHYIILTFDPTDEPTPPPLEADLRWVTFVVLSMALRALLQRWISARRRRKR